MTIWERLFGTPERAAEAIDGADQIDLCYWMADVNDARCAPDKCVNCFFEYDYYGCERKGITTLEWLMQEIEGDES